MSGRLEVHRLALRLDSAFARAQAVGAGDPELLSDLARYLCVLVAGFLEQALVEVLLEHARRTSGPAVQSYVEAKLRRFTNPNSQGVIGLLSSFDPDWGHDLEGFLLGQTKDAVDSVVALRHRISHGRHVGVTLARIAGYYKQVRDTVDHIVDLCIP